MFLLSWGKRRKPTFPVETNIFVRGGVYPCTVHELWVHNHCVKSGAERQATELNYAQWSAVRAYLQEHPEHVDKSVAIA